MCVSIGAFKTRSKKCIFKGGRKIPQGGPPPCFIKFYYKAVRSAKLYYKDILCKLNLYYNLLFCEAKLYYNLEFCKMTVM